MVNVLESTQEWKEGEIIVNSGIGSYTPCFSLDSASGDPDCVEYESLIFYLVSAGGVFN
jgi:hypothetical protein